jgi:diaminopimelate decarboxylase
MDNKFPLDKLKNIPTPFYYYDLDVLRSTLDNAKHESERYGYKLHYAVKANANPGLLKIISSYGLGADCVSWNEIERALSTGFKSDEIVFAGVGKTDRDIEAALKADIYCFNVESIAEMEVINLLATRIGKTAVIALRINPYVEAHTHKYITTGIEESKFGIGIWELDNVLLRLADLKSVKLKGVHFHIGSQVTKMSVFESLCSRINEVRDWFISRNIVIDLINAGGGLGIDYTNPGRTAPFKEYFTIFHKLLKLRSDQVLHFEPGRAITGQCGTLFSRVLYIKNGGNSRFVVIDAGMTDLLRPALYQAFHKIENLSSKGKPEKYDIVGPVCESSDTFGKYVDLPETRRGDFIAIRSAGAYGEVMASRYNLRDLPASVFSDEI